MASILSDTTTNKHNISSANQNVSHALPHSHTLQSLNEKIGTYVVNTMIAYLQANEQAKKHYKENTEKYLNEPVFWYPPSYLQTLDDCKEKGRLDFLIRKGVRIHGWFPPKYFQNTKNLGTHHTSSPTSQVTEFTLKKGVKASKAMEALFPNNNIAKGPSSILGDCSNLCQVVHYQAIRHFIGNKKFDKLFGYTSKGRLMIGCYTRVHQKNPLDVFVTTKDGAELPIGSRVAFANNENYTIKHPIGLSASMNAIYMGNGKYLALGLSSKGLTSKEIKKYLDNAFDLPPEDDKYLNLPCKQWYKERNTASSLERSKQIPNSLMDNYINSEDGYLRRSACLLNAKLIQKIQNIPLENLSFETLIKQYEEDLMIESNTADEKFKKLILAAEQKEAKTNKKQLLSKR